MRLQGYPLMKIPAQPAPCCLALPVHRMLRVSALTPTPSRLAPEFFPAVPSCFDELQEFRLRHCCARDGERMDVNLMRPFFVVEHKRVFRKRTQKKMSAWNLRIAS